MTRLPAPIDSHDPDDSLNSIAWFTQFDSEEELRQSLNEPPPGPRVAPDGGLGRPWRILIAVAVVALLIFGAGTCTGNKLNDAEVRDLMLDITSLETSAGANHDSAEYWQSEATSATSAFEAVERDVESLTATLRLLELRAAEASETIAALKGDVQQQKATPEPSAPAVIEADSGGWQTCTASWYGAECYGNSTANGTYYDADAWGVAHKSLPFGTMIEIAYNGQTVTAPVFDRGPFVAGRTFDLSAAVARALGFSGVQTISWRVVS